MSARKTETHFYPGGETDELAAIDAGFGMDMKRTIGNLQTQWLESEDNLAKWCRLICVIFTNFFCVLTAFTFDTLGRVVNSLPATAVF